MAQYIDPILTACSFSHAHVCVHSVINIFSCYQTVLGRSWGERLAGSRRSYIAPAKFWSNNNLENSEASEVEDEQNLYFSTPGALNIQNDTSSSGAHSTSEKSLPGPSLDDARDARSQNEVSRRYYTSKIVVSNVMSLVPKMCEVSEFILRNQVNYAFITETWIRSSVVDSVIDIPGFSVLRRDRQSDHHGRICLYVKDASYKKLDELSCCP